MKQLFQQFLGFSIIGVIATLIDFLVLTALTSGLHIHYLTSAAIAFIIATIFNYLASMRYIFTSRYSKQERHKEILLFVTLSLIGLGLNQVLMWLLVEFAHIFYLLAKIFATGIVMLWNFISRKVWLEAPSGK